MRQQTLFAFLLGIIVGGFALLVALGPGDEEAASSGGEIAPQTTAVPVGTSQNGPVAIDSTDDAALALQLGQASFDREWERVNAVAQVLRERTGRAASGSASRVTPRAGTSLIGMDHEYRRRVFLLDLFNRDTPATRAFQSDASTEEKERRLTDLFLAPTIKATDEVVRRDAAFLLARLESNGARNVLVRALEDPNEQLADLAAEALARADDSLADQALIGVLRSDLDPRLRIRTIRALALTGDLAGGGSTADALSQTAREDRDLNVRSHAIAALARTDLTRSAAGRRALRTLAEDDGEDLVLRQASVAAMRAHRALSHHLPRGLLDALQRLLGKTRGALRIEVIDALAETGGRESLDLLEATLLATGDPNEQDAIRRAVESLKKRAVDQ